MNELNPILKIAKRALYVLSLCYTILIFVIGIDTSFDYFACGLILSLNFFQLIKSRSNTFIFLILFVIAYSNYSVIYSNFINPLHIYFTDGITSDVTHASINILALFNILIFFLCNFSAIEEDKFFEHENYIYGNTVVLIGIWFIILLLIIFGFKRPEIEGARGVPSAYYEYAIVVFIIYFYLSQNRRGFIILGVFLLALYVLQNFVFGGRIYGIQLLLACYLMFFRNRFSKTTFYSILIVMFIFMNFIGIVRGHILSSNLSVANIFNDIITYGFTLDTAYSAYFTSQSYIYVYDLIPNSERLVHLLDFIKAIFTGYGSNIESTPQYNSSLYILHYNGGFVPHFFYYYIGPIGILLGGILVSFYINVIKTLKNFDSPYYYCAIVFVSCSAFRWYLYTPLGLLRSVLILELLLWLSLKANKLLNNESTEI